MYANVIRVRYKSKDDMEQAKQKLMPLVEGMGTMPGFQGFTWVKLSDTESVSLAVFATPEAAKVAREKNPPKAVELAGAHLAGPPAIEHGAVIVAK